MADIFLPPARGPRRDSPPQDRPFPVRDGLKVTPLLLAAEMYPELERLVMGAREAAFLAFRVFDPQTATRSAEAKAAGLADWAALLKARVAAGVTVRVLLTDFEPTVAHQLHATSWSSFRALRDVLASFQPLRASGQAVRACASCHPRTKPDAAAREVARTVLPAAVPAVFPGAGEREASRSAMATSLR